MDLSTIHQGVHKRRKKKRVGRGVGSGHGKTSGKGHKGQRSRAGYSLTSPLFEGGTMPLFRRIPKRGFSNARFGRSYHIVNVGALDDAFADGDVVDPESLKQKGLAKGNADGVRILGQGEVTKKLTVKAHHFTKSALEKISANGGTTEVIPPPQKPKKNKMKPNKVKEG